jgi:hypothetical protein
MAAQLFVGPWPIFQFLDLYTDSRTPSMVDQPVANRIPTHRTAQTQNKHTQTFMSQVRFKPMITVFEHVKTVHALNRAVTMISNPSNCHPEEAAFWFHRL